MQCSTIEMLITSGKCVSFKSQRWILTTLMRHKWVILCVYIDFLCRVLIMNHQFEGAVNFTASLSHISRSMFHRPCSLWAFMASHMAPVYSIWYLILFKFREGNASAKCFMTYFCLWSFWIIYCENRYVRIKCPGDLTPGNSHFLQRPRRKLMVA